MAKKQKSPEEKKRRTYTKVRQSLRLVKTGCWSTNTFKKKLFSVLKAQTIVIIFNSNIPCSVLSNVQHGLVDITAGDVPKGVLRFLLVSLVNLQQYQN